MTGENAETREYVNESYEAAEDALNMASNSIPDELKEVPGFLVDLNLRQAQIFASLSIVEALDDLRTTIVEQMQNRADEGNPELQRISDALERLTNR